MITVGWVFASNTFHIIEEESSKCRMVSTTKRSARKKNSSSMVSETESFENLEEAEEELNPLRVCDHCEDQYHQ